MSIINKIISAAILVVCAGAFASSILLEKYDKPMRLNALSYQVDTPQGPILLNNVYTHNIWLIGFTDCQIPLTANTVGTINGTKTIIDFRENIGSTTGFAVIKNTIALKSVVFDLPCIEGIKNINIKLKDNWME